MRQTEPVTAPGGRFCARLNVRPGRRPVRLWACLSGSATPSHPGGDSRQVSPHISRSESGRDGFPASSCRHAGTRRR